MIKSTGRALLVGVFAVLLSIGFMSTFKAPTSSLPSALQKEQSPMVITYRGVLPCADCAGLTLTLILNPSGIYQLESMYADKGTFQEKGSWRLEKGILTLSHSTQKFRRLDNNTLEMLGQDEQPIQSDLNYKLLRLP